MEVIERVWGMERGRASEGAIQTSITCSRFSVNVIYVIADDWEGSLCKPVRTPQQQSDLGQVVCGWPMVSKQVLPEVNHPLSLWWRIFFLSLRFAFSWNIILYLLISHRLNEVKFDLNWWYLNNIHYHCFRTRTAVIKSHTNSAMQLTYEPVPWSSENDLIPYYYWLWPSTHSPNRVILNHCT